jgi:hypothetical protein
MAPIDMIIAGGNLTRGIHIQKMKLVKLPIQVWRSAVERL